MTLAGLSAVWAFEEVVAVYAEIRDPTFWGTLEEGHWGSAGGRPGVCMPEFGNAGRASY